MKRVTVNDITVARCTSCHGIWFDLMEHRHLREAAGAASIDVGPTVKGEDLQSKVKMSCPRCKATMSRLRDVDQRDIIYEYCSICNGAFFDAGEFRHYAEHSFVG